MEHYILFYKNNVLGVYSNYDKAKLYVLSCFQNKLLNENVNIKVYQKNSCYLIREETITNTLQKNNLHKNVQKNNNQQFVNTSPEIIFKDDYNLPFEEINEKSSFLLDKIENMNNSKNNNSKNNSKIISNKEIEKLAEDKIKLQHNLNMLKKQKEQLQEREQIYNTDIELFNKFNKMKTENESFEIPELFIKKYNILLKLKESNTLSCENFYKEYNPTNNYSEHFSPNNYELDFEKDSSSESENEEFEINKMTKSSMYEDDSDYSTSEEENNA